MKSDISARSDASLLDSPRGRRTDIRENKETTGSGNSTINMHLLNRIAHVMPRNYRRASIAFASTLPIMLLLMTALAVTAILGGASVLPFIAVGGEGLIVAAGVLGTYFVYQEDSNIRRSFRNFFSHAGQDIRQFFNRTPIIVQGKLLVSEVADLKVLSEMMGHDFSDYIVSTAGSNVNKNELANILSTIWDLNNEDTEVGTLRDLAVGYMTNQRYISAKNINYEQSLIKFLTLTMALGEACRKSNDFPRINPEEKDSSSEGEEIIFDNLSQKNVIELYQDIEKQYIQFIAGENVDAESMRKMLLITKSIVEQGGNIEDINALLQDNETTLTPDTVIEIASVGTDENKGTRDNLPPTSTKVRHKTAKVAPSTENFTGVEPQSR